MRDKIRSEFHHRLEQYPEVMAFYEAGSASFGRVDEYSDIDFAVVVKDDFEAKAIRIIEDIMQGIGPIERQYILPKPTWHGFWQGFYKLANTSSYLMLDIVVILESAPSYFTEVEMHGVPIIYFDKTQRVGKEHVDVADARIQMQRRIERLRFIADMLYNFVEKEVARDRIVDAIDLYNNMFLRTLVDLLRIKYDPFRYSFGNRYLSYDLPGSVYTEIKDLFFVSNVQDLLYKKEIVLQKIKALLAEDLLQSADSIGV